MSDFTGNSLSATPIYTGFWTNWSYGPIKGATITLTNRNGGLLTAFLTLFVTFVGRSFWRLFCFVAHLLSSQKTPQDGLYHQSQAVLRNATTGLDALENFLHLMWAWRAGGRKPLSRLVQLISITASVVAAFYVSSIFSSRISTATGDEVLISSPRCGVLEPFQDTSLRENAGPFQSYLSRLQAAAASYAQQCYMSNGTARECSIYVKEKIPTFVSTNASCPFPGKEKICRASKAIRIDTGLINSHEHFGINAAPTDRFVFRRVYQCAPLTTEGYSKNGTAYASNDESLYASDPSKFKDSTSYEATRYFYGRSLSVRVDNSTQTYAYPIYPTGFDPGTADYVIYVTDSVVPTPDYFPIPELQSDAQDSMLVFLSANNLRFLEPVDDDMYSAHRPGFPLSNIYVNSSQTISTYTSDAPATVLGCAMKHQFCNPSQKKCTSLTYSDKAFNETQGLWSGASQRQTFESWYDVYQNFAYSITVTIMTLGASALLARETLMQGLQAPLPPNQWQKEVMYWHDITMAGLQRAVVEIAAGPFDVSLDRLVKKLPGPAAKQLCQNQKIRNTAHTSFSVLGLSLTLCIGTMIILLSRMAEPLLCLFQRRRRKGIYRRLEWVTNQTLQLQRMAHEVVSSGGKWTDAAESVPITGKDELLVTLDITDEAHPLLVRSSLSSQPPTQGPEKIEEQSSSLTGGDATTNDGLANDAIIPLQPANSSDFSTSDDGQGNQQIVSQHHSTTPLVSPSGEAESVHAEQMMPPQRSDSHDAPLANSELALAYGEQMTSPTRPTREAEAARGQSLSPVDTGRRDDVDWFIAARMV